METSFFNPVNDENLAITISVAEFDPIAQR
jgi:hypothetical protein